MSKTCICATVVMLATIAAVAATTSWGEDVAARPFAATAVQTGQWSEGGKTLRGYVATKRFEIGLHEQTVDAYRLELKEGVDYVGSAVEATAVAALCGTAGIASGDSWIIDAPVVEQGQKSVVVRGPVHGKSGGNVMVAVTVAFRTQ